MISNVCGLDYQEFEVHDRGQSLLPRPVCIHRDWTGNWKIRQRQKETKGCRDYLFRTTANWNKLDKEESQWVREDGQLLARAGWDDGTPNMCFESGLETQTLDLMVTCWVAKLWSETVALKRRDS